MRHVVIHFSWRMQISKKNPTNVNRLRLSKILILKSNTSEVFLKSDVLKSKDNP